MTFNVRVKEEITKLPINTIEKRMELSSFLRYNSKQEKNHITITLENASIARRIYKNVKEIFGINIKITVRYQKRFRVKQIYILEFFDKVDYILESLNIISNGKKKDPSEFEMEAREEKIAYFKGAFLAVGSVSDPAISGYHMEMIFSLKKDALFIIKLLDELGFKAKYIKRSNKYMVYIKSAEVISDIIRLFKATNSLFYYEDIRIYRDHKNMVNRLNNCDIANQEKTINTAMKQLKDIEYIYENDLINLFDDKTQKVIEYRKKNPDMSYQDLADVITDNESFSISKSGVNHAFIRVRKLLDNVKK
ncbi:MAG: DNA-binding protein WhiA [Bacilli bacterium]|nr:DNA-binding protein WhiA [Bacilli bacterium]